MNQRRVLRIGLGGAALVIAPALLLLGDDTGPPNESPTTIPVTTAQVTTVSVSATSSTPATAAVPTPTTPPPPVYQSSVEEVVASDVPASWRAGCPVGIDGLRSVNVSHWGLDGQLHTGTLVVAAEVADDIVDIMASLFVAGFPIERMEPVDIYDGDDDRSMAANNTSAFNCRAVTGGSRWSEHSYGIAVDVNPLLNPYVIGDTVLPPEGAAYADRSLDHPGMIHEGDEVVEAFSARGWVWGGTWSSSKDYQHFSTTGR